MKDKINDYTRPTVIVTEIYPEGMLCESGIGENDDLEGVEINPGKW